MRGVERVARVVMAGAVLLLGVWIPSTAYAADATLTEAMLVAPAGYTVETTVALTKADLEASGARITGGDDTLRSAFQRIVKRADGLLVFIAVVELSTDDGANKSVDLAFDGVTPAPVPFDTGIPGANAATVSLQGRSAEGLAVSKGVMMIISVAAVMDGSQIEVASVRQAAIDTANAQLAALPLVSRKAGLTLIGKAIGLAAATAIIGVIVSLVRRGSKKSAAIAPSLPAVAPNRWATNQPTSSGFAGARLPFESGQAQPRPTSSTPIATAPRPRPGPAPTVGSARGSDDFIAKPGRRLD